MKVLENKIDFSVVFSVKNANPNGDPLDGNRPRVNYEGYGEVTDVCLKRKMRNRMQSDGKEVFVQSDDNVTDGKKSLSERFNDFLKILPESNRKNKEFVYNAVCEKWADVRTFGQVFAFKSQKDVDEVSLGVRGPVTIQSAFSVEPVIVESTQITKSVNSETTEKGKKSSDTMGLKHRINKAVYVSCGSISPQLASKTGFTEEDAEEVKKALINLFEGDESSARPSGSMVVKGVIWWKHNNRTGQYSSAKVHESLHVAPDGTFDIEPLDGLVPEIAKF